jgi:hypothetical protein
MSLTPSPALVPSPPSRADRLAPLAVAVVVTALGVVVSFAEGKPVFPLDDAYITAHNALVLRHGVDPSFPGAAATTGSTSVFHLCLAALVSIVLPLARGMQCLSWLGAGLFGAGLVRFGLASGVSTRWSVALAVAGLTAGYGPMHLTNGLETSAAMAAVAWVLALAQEDRAAARLVVPALCGVMPFIRPELALLSALVLALRAHDRRGAVDASPGAALLRDVAVASVAALPWLAVLGFTSGAVVPSTVGVKRAFFAESCVPGGLRALTVAFALARFAVHVGAPTLGFALLLRRARGGVGLAAAAFCAGVVGAYWLYLPGALQHNTQRYLYLLLPAVFAGVGLGLGEASARVRTTARALLVLGLVGNAAWAPTHLAERAARIRFTREELRGVSEWSRRHLPPSAVVMAHDIGYLSVTTPFRIVDLVGLKAPTSAAAHRALTLPTCGRGRGAAIARIAQQAGATHLVVWAEWDGIFQITEGLRAAGVPLRLLRDSRAGYRVFALTPPRDAGDLRVGSAP